ncbi:MAG: thiamine phosphate synthase [Nitrospirae bacterium]|nr:thiamine phosphate synthase [Candidatus Manganitrophaceae bacterium]
MFPLYLITDPILYPKSTEISRPFPTGTEARKLLLEAVGQALSGGARLIQYRDKKSPRSEMYETAKQLRRITLEYGATLIINDQIDLALAVGADGVHLGQEDLPLWVARKILGNEAIIGISTHTLDEAVSAEEEGADYIGFGPIFKTKTKSDIRTPVGVEAITAIKQKIRVPVYAIGGIERAHLSKLILAGADGVAVISAVAGKLQSNVEEWLGLFRRFGKALS